MEELSQEGGINPYLLLFLDAESYTEKLNVLSLCKDKLDDSVINAMAASMEIEVPDGPIEKRYASLRDCIRTHVRYEGTRLKIALCLYDNGGKGGYTYWRQRTFQQ